MPNYNPNSPAVLGMEWRPTVQQDITLSGTSQGIAFRIVPGAVTLNAIHPFIKSVVDNPGIAVEIVTSLQPPAPVSTGEVEENFYIATNAGMVSTGWETQEPQFSTSATDLRQALDEFPPNGDDHIHNRSKLGPNAKLKFSGRGFAGATPLANKRIEQVAIQALVRTDRNENSTRQGPRVQGLLRLTANSEQKDWLQDRGKRAPADNKWRRLEIGEWEKNPATNKPWTLAEVNAIISNTATDNFGFQIDSATIAAGVDGFHCGWLTLEVESTGITTGDVRKGFYYSADPPIPGWNSYTLGSTSAESANTYYWVHIYPLSASGSFTIPMLRDMRTDFQVSSVATDANLQHRQVYITNLSAGGVIQSASAIKGAMIPVLMSASGTFNTMSQAYAELANLSEDASSTANLAQTITTTGGTPPHYSSIRFPFGWASATKPTAPLTVEIRYGVGASTGGGTLLAQIFVQPEEASSTFADRNITLGPGIDPPATTQLFVLIDSQAAQDTGWKIGRLDTRSDFLVSPTASNVELQGQGGETDSQHYGATEFERYDIPLILMGAPGGVGGTPEPSLPTLTATVESGQ